MKATMSIFRREFAAKREFLLVAVAAVAIACLMPYLPGFETQNPVDVRSVTSQVLALGLGLALAVGLGATVFGSDLSAGRLGFFFARPVGAAALWTGRIAASLAIVLACEAVVVIPALIMEKSFFLRLNATAWRANFVALVILPFVLLLVSHAVSIMLRARTAWLFLDLAALLAIAVGAWLTVRPLMLMGAVKAVTLMESLLVGAAAIALAAAGLVGTAVGRTDLRRTHGALSVTLWLLLGIAMVGAAAYGNWLRDFEPGDLDHVELFTIAPDGGWIEVAGTTPWRLDVCREFLVSTTDGRWVAVPLPFRTGRGGVRFSSDGSTAVILETGTSEKEGRRLRWIDLREHDPQLRETTLVVTGRATPSVSPDGSRVAILDAALLSVYELANEGLLTTIAIPKSLREAIVLFVEENHLVLFARYDHADAAPLRIAEVDLGSKTIAEIARIRGPFSSSWIAVDAEARHLVLGMEDGEGGMTRRLYDTRSGELIRELAVKGPVTFLADGRIFWISRSEGDRTRLVVESVDGSSRVEHDLGVVPWFWCYGEAVSGSLVASRLEDLKDREQGRTIELIEIDTGEIQKIAEGVLPGYSATWRVWSPGVSATWYVNTPEASRIFEDCTGAIVRWDPGTDDLIHIVGGKQK